jgi:hypothetical protein
MTTLLPERSDILPEGRAPKHIRKFLQAAGGVTPWGENRYRLVLAQCVMVYVGARWHDWSVNDDLLDQGGLEFSKETRKSTYLTRDPTNPRREIAIQADVPAFVRPKPNKPVRIIEEMRWIRRYPDITGWLFQVWYPSSYYSRQHYDVTVAGRPDLPLLGEFPARGQYERQFAHMRGGKIHETFDKMPGESWMERAIQHHEAKIAKDASPNVEWRMLVTLNDMKKARETYERKEREEFEARVKERISPIFSNSLAGGRIREQLARRCLEQGIKLGHVGN